MDISFSESEKENIINIFLMNRFQEKDIESGIILTESDLKDLLAEFFTKVAENFQLKLEDES